MLAVFPSEESELSENSNIFQEKEERIADEEKCTLAPKRSILRFKRQLSQADSVTMPASIDLCLEDINTKAVLFGPNKMLSSAIARQTAMQNYEALETEELEAALENYYAFEMLDPEVVDSHAVKRARLSSISFKEQRARTFLIDEEPQKVSRALSDVSAVKSDDMVRL